MKERNNLIMTLTDSVKKRLGEGYSVSIQEVLKNNDTKLTGMTISTANSNISPTIYLEEIFAAHQNGVNIEQCVERIIEIYEHSKSEDANFDIDSILSWQNVKNNIYLTLINTEKNKERLKDIPSIPFHDLSAIFKIHLCSDNSGTTSITIHNNFLEMWDFTPAELYSIALKNTERIFNYKIESMYEVLSSMGFPVDGINIPMYVLTNNAKINGATCILYNDVLQNFADLKNDDLYILPSSIHEALLIPACFVDAPLDLVVLVRLVNKSEVSDEEILSDNVYYYSRETNEITLI